MRQLATTYTTDAVPALLQTAPVHMAESPVLVEVWRAVKANLYKIGAFLAAGLIATYVISSRIPRSYEAIVTLELDRDSYAGLVGEQSHHAGYAVDDDLYMATQIKLIQLDSVLRPVAQKYHLMSGERKAVNGEGIPNGPIELRGLKITRPPNTRIFQIRYKSADPEIAAGVANGIAESYAEHSHSARLRSTANMSRYAEQQLQDLRARMERSSFALARRQKELNLVNADEKISLVSARLVQFNTEYMQAQAERFRREAAFNAANDGNLDTAQASPLSEPLQKLVERRNEIREKFTQVKEHYGAEHPEYRRQFAQLAELDRQIESMKQSITKRLEALYHEALDREAMVGDSLRKAKAESDRLNDKYFAYERLKREAESDKRLYEQLEQRMKEADINSSFRNDTIRIVDPARPPDRPSTPNIPLNLSLAFVMCSGIGVGAAVICERRNDSVRKCAEVQAQFHVTVLGTLPALKPIKRTEAQAWAISESASDAVSPELSRNPQRADAVAFSEAVRCLLNIVQLHCGLLRMRTLLVTSAVAGEGRTTVAAHLAVVNAMKNRKTLLIDGDLRRPSVHRIFDLPNSRGLADSTSDGPEWKTTLLRHPILADLDILPAGTPTAGCFDLLGDRIASVLERASAEYDLVIVDAPPALGCSETLPMATAADAVVLTIAAGETSRQAVHTMLSNMRSARVRVLGTVVNKVAPADCESMVYSAHYTRAGKSRA